MAGRSGSALLLLGLIALTVFAVTLTIDQADVRVLLLGATTAALGLVIRRRAARLERSRAGRFRLLRRLLGHTEDDDPEGRL